MTVRMHVCTDRGWWSFHWWLSDDVLAMSEKQRGAWLMGMWPSRVIIWERA